MFSLKQILGQHGAPKPDATEPKSTALKSQDAVLKRLTLQLTQQQRLNHAWQQATSELMHAELANYSQATAIEGDTLIVVTESGLVANKIKLLATQLIPTLNKLINVKCLPSQRCNLTAIRAKVQAKSLLKQGTKRITGLSKVAAEELASFAQTTKNPKLAEAIKKLSRHQR